MLLADVFTEILKEIYNSLMAELISLKLIGIIISPLQNVTIVFPEHENLGIHTGLMILAPVIAEISQEADNLLMAESNLHDKR